MKKFGLAALLAVSAVVIFFLFFSSHKGNPPPRPEANSAISLPSLTNVGSLRQRVDPIFITPQVSGESPTSAEAVVPPTSSTAAAPTNAPLEFTKHPPETVMENLRSAFRSYQSMFRENPVGTNPEITHALNGGNRRQARFLEEEDGMRINSRGELVDPWGTPFFFHQLSGTQMEIHSAGPDRVMWTTDDLVMK